MAEGIKKFRELLLHDPEFQSKLKAAAENYTGEQTEEAVFNNVIVPLAAEYGITATYDEFKDYIAGLSDQELNTDEISQVAGGDKGGGFGGANCYVLGAGFGGGGGSSSGDLCVLVGAGWGSVGCIGEGESDSEV